MITKRLLFLELSKMLDNGIAMEQYRQSKPSTEQLVEGGRLMREYQAANRLLEDQALALEDPNLAAAAGSIHYVCSLHKDMASQNLYGALLYLHKAAVEMLKMHDYSVAVDPEPIPDISLPRAPHMSVSSGIFPDRTIEDINPVGRKFGHSTVSPVPDNEPQHEPVSSSEHIINQVVDEVIDDAIRAFKEIPTNTAQSSLASANENVPANSDPFSQFDDGCDRMLKYVEDNSPSPERVQQVLNEAILTPEQNRQVLDSVRLSNIEMEKQKANVPNHLDTNPHCQVIYDAFQPMAPETLAILKALGINHEPQVTAGPGLLQVKKVEKVIAHAENCTDHVATVGSTEPGLTETPRAFQPRGYYTDEEGNRDDGEWPGTHYDPETDSIVPDEDETVTPRIEGDALVSANWPVNAEQALLSYAKPKDDGLGTMMSSVNGIVGQPPSGDSPGWIAHYQNSEHKPEPIAPTEVWTFVPAESLTGEADVKDNG